MCDHAGYFTGTTRYDRRKKVMRYVVTCDGCGAVMREIETEPYHPQFDPRGNEPYLHTLQQRPSAA
jgi:hypothetical protein